MAKPRIIIEKNKEYGYLTVLDKSLEKDKYGHILYRVRCRCGQEFNATASFLTSDNPKCVHCGRKHRNYKKKVCSIKGERFGSWMVLDLAENKINGNYMYKCKCLKCGNISYKNKSQLLNSHGVGCMNCIPDYHFISSGTYSEGILPDGTKFLIDNDIIDEFSKYNWNKNDKGYIRRGNRNLPKMLLHWFVLGYNKPPQNGFCIDHINRNKQDCRKSNLRLVSTHQNSMNKSKQANNTSGFIGVCYEKRSKRYIARIGYNNEDVRLLSHFDAEECAKAYDYAADILFGEFRGPRNMKAAASSKIKDLIWKKCQRYLAKEKLTTRRCGFFIAI